jgi:hypothetical protein
MACQTAPKPDHPAQYQRFRDLAAELEAEGDEKAVKQAVKRLGKGPGTPRRKRKLGSKFVIAHTIGSACVRETPSG